MVLSIKNGFYKIKKSIFQPNYARYEKMFRSKIVHFKKIYQFDFDHFLEKRTLLILIVKKIMLLKIKNSIFQANIISHPIKGCEIMLQIKVVVFEKLYKFYIEHFLIGIIVFVDMIYFYILTL